jgi:hypothetical protein
MRGRSSSIAHLDMESVRICRQTMIGWLLGDCFTSRPMLATTAWPDAASNLSRTSLHENQDILYRIINYCNILAYILSYGVLRSVNHCFALVESWRQAKCQGAQHERTQAAMKSVMPTATAMAAATALSWLSAMRSSWAKIAYNLRVRPVITHHPSPSITPIYQLYHLEIRHQSPKMPGYICYTCW